MNQRAREREALVSLWSMRSCLSRQIFPRCVLPAQRTVSRGSVIIKPTRSIGRRSGTLWQVQVRFRKRWTRWWWREQCFYYTSSLFISQHGALRVSRTSRAHTGYVAAAMQDSGCGSVSGARCQCRAAPRSGCGRQIPKSSSLISGGLRRAAPCLPSCRPFPGSRRCRTANVFGTALMLAVVMSVCSSVGRVAGSSHGVARMLSAPPRSIS